MFAYSGHIAGRCDAISLSAFTLFIRWVVYFTLISLVAPSEQDCFTPILDFYMILYDISIWWSTLLCQVFAESPQNTHFHISLCDCLLTLKKYESMRWTVGVCLFTRMSGQKNAALVYSKWILAWKWCRFCTALLRDHLAVKQRASLMSCGSALLFTCSNINMTSCFIFMD